MELIAGQGLIAILSRQPAPTGKPFPKGGEMVVAMRENQAFDTADTGCQPVPDHGRGDPVKRAVALLQPPAVELQHQQDLSTFKMAVIVLVGPTNALADLQPLMPRVLEKFPYAKSGEALRSILVLPQVEKQAKKRGAAVSRCPV